MKKLMKRHGRPEVIVTDRLRSYGAALKDLGRGDDREMGRWLNNQAENSHLPFRRRERAMLRFRRIRTLQKFTSVHNHFPTERHLQNRDTFKQIRAAALAEWRGLLAADANAGEGKRRLVHIGLTALGKTMLRSMRLDIFPLLGRLREGLCPQRVSVPYQL